MNLSAARYECICRSKSIDTSEEALEAANILFRNFYYDSFSKDSCYFDIKSAMRYLNVGKTTFYKYLKQDLPYYKVTGTNSKVFRKKEIDKWLNKYKKGER